MKVPFLIGFILAILVFSGCGKNPMTSLDSKVVEVSGEVFAETPSKRWGFQIRDPETCNKLANVFSRAEQASDLKRQGVAAFDIHLADGASFHIELCEGNLARIDGHAVVVETKAIVDTLMNSVN